MKSSKKTRAFTLTELLVVVIVLGVLAAVAVPKFSRVLETRRTTEAEDMLSAVRAEQEKRCVLGQNYAGDFSEMSTVAFSDIGNSQARTSNYTYTLTSTGITADRGAASDNYVLKIPSYKTGEICCEGAGCSSLNKSYRLCSEIGVPADDECAAEDIITPEPELDPCEVAPNDCICSTYANANPCQCNPLYQQANPCECTPSTETCCTGGQVWNEEKQSCEDACEEKYTPALQMQGADSCPGKDDQNEYVCDGHFRGTCTDAFVIQASAQKASFWQIDPFLSFKNALAQYKCPTGKSWWQAGGGQCPDNASYGCCCDSTGYSCVSLSTPEEITPPYEEPQDCPEGQKWDYDKSACVSICSSGFVYDSDSKTCVSASSTPSCPAGYHYDSTVGACALDEVAVQHWVRQVTCCGDGNMTGGDTDVGGGGEGDGDEEDNVCQPPANEPSSMSCPGGYSGTMTRTWNYETCSWNEWTGCVCTPPDGETASKPCPSEDYYAGEMTRTWDSQNCQWSAWDYSSCKPKVACCQLVKRSVEFKWSSGSVLGSYCNSYDTEETSSKITYYGNTAMTEWQNASNSKNICPSAAQEGVILSGSKKGWSCYRNAYWAGSSNGCVNPQARADVWICRDIPWSVGTVKKCSPDEITYL